MAARSQAGFSQFGTHETSISQREGNRSRTTESDEPDNDLSHVELALPPLPRGVHLTVRHTAGLGVTAGQLSGGGVRAQASPCGSTRGAGGSGTLAQNRGNA